MTKNVNDKSSSANVTISPSVRPSLSETVEAVRKQVNYYAFQNLHDGRIHPAYHEMCLIMAEMYISPPGRQFKVNGMDTPAEVIKEVYATLTADHLVMVMESFRNVTERVYNAKAYLRTALYNSAFELDAHYANQYRHDMSNG